MQPCRICRFAVIPLEDNCGLIEWVPHTETLRSCITSAYHAHGERPEKQTAAIADLYKRNPKVECLSQRPLQRKCSAPSSHALHSLLLLAQSVWEAASSLHTSVGRRNLHLPWWCKAGDLHLHHGLHMLTRTLCCASLLEGCMQCPRARGSAWVRPAAATAVLRRG